MAGQLPEHWEALPNCALFDEIKDRDCPDEEMLSVTIKKGVEVSVHRKTHEVQSVEMMAKLFEVSRSGYYAWRSRPACERSRVEERFIEENKGIMSLKDA